jgi:hypothetical protein
VNNDWSEMRLNILSETHSFFQCNDVTTTYAGSGGAICASGDGMMEVERRTFRQCIITFERGGGMYWK